MDDYFKIFDKQKDPLKLYGDEAFPGFAGAHRKVVFWRGEETGDHQLPHLQAGKGRPFLREDFRSR